MRTPYSISPCALGISGYFVKFRIAMPNSVCFFLAMDTPHSVMPAEAGTHDTWPRGCGDLRGSPPPRGRRLRRVEPLGVKVAQHVEFLLARRLGGLDLVGEQQLEAGIILHLLARDALMERQHLHLAGVLVEAHDREVGDDAP